MKRAVSKCKCLWLVLVLGVIVHQSVSSQAQAPWLSATSGIESLRWHYHGSVDDYYDTHDNLVLGLSLHPPLHHIVQPEIGVRSTIRGSPTFRSVHLGLQVTPLRRIGIHFGVAFARSDWVEDASCSDGPCDRKEHPGRSHIEARLGYDLRQRHHFVFGPTVWLLEPIHREVSLIGSTIHVRALGVGLR